MDVPIEFWVIIGGVVVFIVYYIALAKFNIIRRPKSFPISDAQTYAEHHIVLKGKLYAKISTRVLHKVIFKNPEVVSHFRFVNYPVYVIFGPHLCYDSYRFLRVTKQNENIQLFQVRKDAYKDASDEEKAKIEGYLRDRKYATIVDGVHCYVENASREGEESGGTEHTNNPVLCVKYERDFDKLLRYCKAVDKARIIDAVGEENIYLTREDGTYGRASHRKVVFLKVVVLKESYDDEDSIGYGEDDLIKSLREEASASQMQGDA